MRFTKTMIVAAAMMSLAAVTGRAADLPSKAPSGLSSFFSTGYPYGSSGFFFGVFTEGGGGSVNATVPGVGSASLTTTSAGVGGTLGYAWGQKNSPVAMSVEADFGWTNFNGSTAGLSFDGPAAFEQRFVLFTPLSSVLSVLPGLPSLGTLPPFGALPTGVTATNLQVGLMAGVDENDISMNFPGLSSNREWRVAPMIGIVGMEQLSNGTAMRVWLKTVFPDRGVCIGPAGNACAGIGQQVKAGIGVYW